VWQDQPCEGISAHGASYYSDEFAVFHEHGKVSPFAKALGVREGTAENRLEFYPDNSAVLLESSRCPWIVTFHALSGSARWKPKAMTVGGGMLGLLANALAARQRPERALTILNGWLGEPRFLQATEVKPEMWWRRLPPIKS